MLRAVLTSHLFSQAELTVLQLWSHELNFVLNQRLRLLADVFYLLFGL